MTPRAALWKLSLRTNPDAEEAVCALLERLYQTPASVAQKPGALRVTVTVYLNDPKLIAPARQAQLRQGLRELRILGLDPAPARLTISRLRPVDWAESWKHHFKPFLVRNRLLIKPSWSRRRPRAGQEVLVLDPGLSFGTGHHPTTRFCLQELVRHAPKNRAASFLDLGTGSGILAIAAAKLGYHPVHALDVDPEAVRTARTNALANGVADRIRLSRADLSRLRPGRPGPADVVCANLSEDVLLQCRSPILSRLKQGARLILAGIPDRHFPTVAQAYHQAGWRLVRTRREGEWRSGSFQQGGDPLS